MSTLKGRFWLGALDSETLFETGWQSFEEEDSEINREDRVANGDLVIDTIATKKLWTLSYASMLQTTYDTFKALYATGATSALSLIVENEDDSTDTYVVKLRPFKRRRELAMDEWYWSCTITIEEV